MIKFLLSFFLLIFLVLIPSYILYSEDVKDQTEISLNYDSHKYSCNELSLLYDDCLSIQSKTISGKEFKYCRDKVDLYSIELNCIEEVQND